MSNPASETVPPARTWRARAADAAVADAGRADDATTTTAARALVDRGLAGAGVAVAILGLLGAIAGWTTTAELLKPADTPVHAPALLLVVVGTPWLLLAVRALALLVLRRRAMPILGRLVPAGLSAAVTRRRPVGVNAALATAITRRVGSVLANGSGRRLAAAGSGVFWTAFAATAILTVWLVTARVALGFGWESSWLPPQLGRTITEIAAAPLASLVESERLQPVAAPPAAPADDEVALAARRAWIRFLSAGIGLYLLLPMLAWTMFNAACGHWLAERWRPVKANLRNTPRTSDPVASATPPNTTTDPAVAAPDVRGACTHLLRLERGAEAPLVPAPLSALEDLGELDTTSTIEGAGAALGTAHTRAIIVAWLPATPDRGVRRRLADLAKAASQPPMIVLDGGDQLRRRETASTTAMRLEDWRILARELELPAIEVDLANLTSEGRALLERTIRGVDDLREAESTSSPRLAAARLDEALAAIGRALDADDPLPGDDAHARAAREIAACLADAGGTDRLTTWTTRLQTWRDLDASDARARITALSEAGLDLVPARLRRGVAWSALGGMLGATACLAAASVAPAALVALPGWAGTGAGIAGLLSLARRPGSGDAASTTTEAESNEAPSLDDRVPALATLAVLLWSQGGDETRTSRLLAAVLPDDNLPNLPDADAARRWIGLMRQRVMDAAASESSS